MTPDELIDAAIDKIGESGDLIPVVRVERTQDPDEVADLMAAACFEWVTDSVDSDGNEHHLDDGEEADFEERYGEVAVHLGAWEGESNEGLGPQMVGEVSATCVNGNDCTVEVTFRQYGFKRCDGRPVALYYVNGWRHR